MMDQDATALLQLLGQLMRILFQMLLMLLVYINYCQFV